MATELKISMDESGKVSVTGPLENQILCFGLLKIAEQVVIEQGKIKQLSNLVKPKHGILKIE
jgi:hypothetical protein